MCAFLELLGDVRGAAGKAGEVLPEAGVLLTNVDAVTCQQTGRRLTGTCIHVYHTWYAISPAAAASESVEVITRPVRTLPFSCSSQWIRGL